MTIRHTVGNILESMSDAIAIPVNTVGVPGAGLAKLAADTYPEWRTYYKALCHHQALQIGEPQVVRCNDGRQLICFPTKTHWTLPSELEWIDHGLAHMVRHHQALRKQNIHSVALPMLGCGLGGLEWAIVRALIYKHFEHHAMDIEIYGP